jgi:hypothetical protein
VSEELSEDAQKLLGRVVILGGEYPGGVVQDSTLWEAADLKYEAYVDAAAELVEKGLAETARNIYLFNLLLPRVQHTSQPKRA